MKRIISCLLAMLLIAALLPLSPAKAYAADPEDGPRQTYSVSISVPQLYTIMTNTGEAQSFGVVSTSFTDGGDIYSVDLFPTYGDLVNVTDSGNTIPIQLYQNGTAINKKDSDLCLYWRDHAATNGFDQNGFANRVLSVKVTDWSNAKLNDRYKATISFTAIVRDIKGNENKIDNLPSCTLELIVQPMTYKVNVLNSIQLDTSLKTGEEIGSLTVSEVSSDAEEMDIAPEYSDLVNVNDPEDRITLTLESDKGYGELNKNGLSSTYKTALPVYRKGTTTGLYDKNGCCSFNIKAKVTDWSKATPGATYRAEITYKVTGRNTAGQTYSQTISERTNLMAVIPGTKTISSVALTGYRNPTAGQTAYTYYAGLALVDSHLTIAEKRWFCITDGKWLANSDTFGAGKTYQLQIVAEAAKDYVFSKDVKYTVNTRTDLVDLEECEVRNITNPQTALLWTKEYSIPKEESKAIENVHLTGYKLPIVGQTVKDYDFEDLILNDVHLKVTKAQWVNLDKNTVLAQNDKFEGGVNYALELTILADKGYVPQEKTIKYYVNSKEEDADSKKNKIKETTLGYEVDFWVVPVKLTASVSKEITSVNITGYTNPAAGTTAGEYKYSDLKPETAAHYALTSAEWYDETGKVYLDKDGKFLPGNTYTLKLKVTAEKEYTIVNEKNLRVLVNSDEKLADSRFTGVNSVGGIYTAEYWTVSYTVPKPETYAIKVTNKGSGSVSASASSSEAGNKITVTAVPVSDKYRFKGWIVVTSKLKTDDIKLVSAEKGQYEFTMPAENVELQAEFEAVPEPEKPEKKAKRLGGADRFATANLICGEGWTKASAVVITSGADYPDALAGTVLAGKLNAPILLTAKDSITNDTINKIKALGATRAYILGGKAAVSEKVEKAIKDAGVNVVRVAGDTRNGTAAQIAYNVGEKAETVYLVSNRNFADALSVSAGAAIQRYPILYLNPDGTVPAETKAALSKLGTKNAVIIGGPAAVSGSANDNVRSLGVSVSRIYGNDRYETSIKVYDELNKLVVFSSKDAAVATGRAFPDALSGAAFAASKGMPVFLAGNTASQELISRTKDAGTVYIFGGNSAVSEAVENQLVK